MPFPLCSGNLGRGTAVESSGFTGRLALTLKKNTQLSELSQAGPSRKLWKKNSQIIFIGCSFLVFNWVDSLVVDPDPLLLAVSHLFAVKSNPRFSFMGGIGKK
jgi:hypothetical protein